jgi:hypothetical protein
MPNRNPFPPDMDALLAQFKIPLSGEIYSLGCLEKRRVTMASQQTRAVNLVHALFENHLRQWRIENKPADKNERWPAYHAWQPRILIVGGSAGGLTAAGYAAYRGAQVMLIEQNAELMAHLKDCDRMLEPRLHEWAAPQPFEDDGSAAYWTGEKVGLPLLDWQQGKARNVREALLEEWGYWSRFYQFPEDCTLSLEELENQRGGHTIRVACGVSLSAKCGDPAPSGQTVYQFRDGNGKLHEFLTNIPIQGCSDKLFDIVIMAVGFGRERRLCDLKGCETARRWLHDKDDGAYFEYRDPTEDEYLPKKVLISGSGDGALIDLFLHLFDFKQADLRKLLQEWDGDRSLERAVRAIEEQIDPGDKNSALKMAWQYLALVTPTVEEWMKRHIRPDVQIELAIKGRGEGATPEEAAFMGAEAFPMHRMMLSALIRLNRAGTPTGFSIVIVPVTGDLPDNPQRVREAEDPDFQKWSYICRAGTTKSPIHKMFAQTPERTDEAVTARHQQGDITRQPIWPFIGEAATPFVRPAISHFIAREKFDDRKNFELFRNADQFHVVSEAFDSTFQAAIYNLACLEPEKQDAFFLGVLRFLMILYDKIYIPDSQAYDGRFFLRIPQIIEKIAAEERKLIGSRVVIRGRNSTCPEKSYEGFLYGNGKLRDFKFSTISDEENRYYNSILNENSISKDVKSFNHALEIISEQCQTAGNSLNEWAENCKKFNSCISGLSGNMIEKWPDPGLTRYWNDKAQLENPARFLKSLGIIDASAPEKALGVWQKCKGNLNRTVYHQELDTLSADETNPKLKKAYQHQREWLDRAYNRMVTRNQGANVFGTVHSGDLAMTSEAESRSGATNRIDASIWKLGLLPSDGFHDLFQKIAAALPPQGSDKRKPISDYVWGPVLENIACATSGIEDPGAKLPAGEPIIDKLNKFSTIESYRIGWVGDIDYQPFGSEMGAMVKTEDPGGADESALLASPRNPHGVS